MSRTEVIDVLNRLIVLHSRSFATYLVSATPWSRQQQDDQATDLLNTIAADHKAIVDRVGEVVIENQGVVNLGEFPMEFTDKHDLSIHYLLGYLLNRQEKMVQEIDRYVSALEGDPVAKALAQEALGASKGHLQSLRELLSHSTATAS